MLPGRRQREERAEAAGTTCKHKHGVLSLGWRTRWAPFAPKSGDIDLATDTQREAPRQRLKIRRLREGPDGSCQRRYVWGPRGGRQARLPPGPRRWASSLVQWPWQRESALRLTLRRRWRGKVSPGTQPGSFRGNGVSSRRSSISRRRGPDCIFRCARCLGGPRCVPCSDSRHAISHVSLLPGVGAKSPVRGAAWDLLRVAEYHPHWT